MPYIPQVARYDLDDEDQLGGPTVLSSGELNYRITNEINRFLSIYPNGLSYSGINTAIGVLECAKLELYRRVAAPYEDKKCVENGDVYDPSLTNTD